MDIRSYLQKESRALDRALGRYLPRPQGRASRHHRAMRYAVLGGGKRIRPIFVLAACRAVGGDARKAVPAACAIELIHNYSLVHDDLPCMDDDRFRRGRQACHVKFGEDTAVLAGDALLTLAFEILSGAPSETLSMIAKAAGARGMAAGQAVDMAHKKKPADRRTLNYINTHKSGDLIAVSVAVGGFLGGGTQSQARVLSRYGRSVGFLFQIVDDILDGEGYAKMAGAVQARKRAERLFQKAAAALSPLGPKARVLNALAKFILLRAVPHGSASKRSEE